VAHHKEQLHHVAEAVRTFADRQLVSMLNEAQTFRAVDVAVGPVEVGSNRIQVDLICPSVSAIPATLAFELQSGWVLAGVPRRGWIDALDEDQRTVLEIALAGFYKLSGVE